jgi:hypothetical protein
VRSAQDPAAVRRNLQKVLAEFRIDAEVSVVEAGEDADMAGGCTSQIQLTHSLKPPGCNP